MAQRVKLTKRTIEGAEPTPAEYTLWDSELPGFGLRVRPSGAKVFTATYRTAGRLRKLTIGSYGTFTADTARDEARKALSRAALGADPAEEKQTARHPEQPEPAVEPTLADLVARYLEKGPGKNHKPSTRREDVRLLEKVILPRLGKETKVADVSRADVVGLQEALSEHQPAANAALRRLSGILSYAEAIGWRPENSNPCKRVELFKEEKRERYLSAEELKTLGKVLRAEEKKRQAGLKGENGPRWSRSAALLVELLLYTGLRPGEVLGLKFKYVDAERGLLRLPDTKTGARTLPLSAPALALLKNAPHADGNPWVCPSAARKGKALTNPAKPWSEIRNAAGLGEVHLHDLRHTYASWAAGGGVSLYQIAAMLGHRQSATTERYSHLSQDPLKVAADLTAGSIAAALAGKEPAEVIPIEQGARP